ncbi:MAG TPA: hypothetical protein VH542_00815 [Steroidobacteraceae bacterium]
MRRVSWYLVSIFLAAALQPLRLPAEEQPGVDSDFLEFLGSLDSDDVAWSAYLSTADAAPASASTVNDTKPTKAPKPVKPAEKGVSEGESK